MYGINRDLFLPVVFGLLSLVSIQCTSSPPSVYLGQGLMAGEITPQSAILQTRLTASDTLVNGALPGRDGWVKFLIGTEKTLADPFMQTNWIAADSTRDHIVKVLTGGLQPDQRYYYRAFYGVDTNAVNRSPVATFRTNPGPDLSAPVSFAVVTGMNYYHFHYGKYNGPDRYQGKDKHLGYPALATLTELAPDYFIGTGDNVYFDHPAERDYERAIERGRQPLPGLFDGKEVTTEAGMRRKYHVQFVQPRYREFFAKVGTYWEKDDHDYRFNDADPYMDLPISHELGIKNFKEQLPVVDPADPDAVTYRTIRLSRDLQIWLVEGRDYRSANDAPDGPEKTIWGAEQREWLKETLLASDATFKLLISPTPMIGPDDAYKKDNHTNPEGFRYERDQFFSWLLENDFLAKNFYIICGDRHWQYHAIHPTGIEEFSTGALVDNNSRAGRLAGDPNSTDPEGLIQQPYVQGTGEQASGGFLLVKTDAGEEEKTLRFQFYDEKGTLLYEEKKTASKGGG